MCVRFSVRIFTFQCGHDHSSLALSRLGMIECQPLMFQCAWFMFQPSSVCACFGRFSPSCLPLFSLCLSSLTFLSLYVCPSLPPPPLSPSLTTRLSFPLFANLESQPFSPIVQLQAHFGME